MKSTDIPFLPNDANIESSLLGAIICYQDSYTAQVKKILTEDFFYSKQNRVIFKSIKSLTEQNKPFDVETICGNIKSKDMEQKKNLLAYVSRLETNAPSPSCILEYSLLLAQSHIRRTVIETSYRNIELAQNPETDELQLLDEAVSPMLSINEHLSKVSSPTIDEAIDEIRKEIIEIKNTGQKVKGIRTFIPSLDLRLGGLGNGRMITIAGRPGSGKTALAVQIATNICLNKHNLKLPVVYYSLEMSSKELIYRFASCLIKYPYSKLDRAEFNDEMGDTFWRALDYVQHSNLEIVDGLHDLSHIVADIKSKKANGARLAIIDFIGLAHPPKGKQNQSREQDISAISRMIKLTARQLNIPILALAQLNREVEKRNTRKPVLSDLRDSGAIEQDSDSVTFTYRPKYAGFDKDENGNDISENEAWLITAKNRHGAVGEDQVHCDIACNVFTEANN